MSDTIGMNSENPNDCEGVDLSRNNSLVDLLTSANFNGTESFFLVELEITTFIRPSFELEADILDIDHTGYVTLIERLEASKLRKKYCAAAEDAEQAQSIARSAAQRRFARGLNLVIAVMSCQHVFREQQVTIGWVD